MRDWKAWLPGALLGTGCILILFINRQRDMPLAAPLESLPDTVAGYAGLDQPISEGEQQVAGMDEYVFRVFPRDTLIAFTLYVGYYESQTQGKTIHSPKNCLPGAGWEELANTTIAVPAGAGDSTVVNRYLLQNGDDQVLVYYWYQGRGRVESNEYRVKWQLLRDAALHGRTEEALVRIVIPLLDGRTPDRADALAREAAGEIIPGMRRVLPS